MKPQSILAAVIVLLLAAGGLVFSGLFSGADTSRSGPETKTTAATDDSNPPVEAPNIGDDTKPAEPVAAEPAATREVVKNENAGASTIGGMVQNRSGDGIAEAEVVLYYGPTNPAFANIAAKRPTGYSAVTDADGNYVFEDIAPAKNYLAVASHPEYAQGSRLGIAVNDGDLSIVAPIILTKGSTIKGTVKAQASQAPVVDAKVELWDMMASNFLDPAQRKPWRETKTDAAGQYEFKNVHFTSFDVLVSAENLATISRRETQIFLTDPQEGDRVFDFELPVGSSIEGLAVDARGAPVADVRIDAEQINQQSNAGISRSSAVSGKDGRFALVGIQDGSYQVSAAKRGFSQKLAGQFPAGTRDLRVQLESRGMIRGKVVDPASRPVTRFELVLVAMRDGVATPTNQAKTYQSADGSFEFDDVEPGEYQLEANADGFAPTKSATFFVDRDHAAENILIQMKLGGGLRGRVVSSTGEPIANADITIQPNNYQNHFLVDLFAQFPNSRPQTTPKVRSGRDGTFELKNLKPESVQVEVKAKGHSSLQKNDIVVNEGSSTDIGVLTLSAGGEIRGRCVDASGRPFADGTVTATPVADPNDPNQTAQAAGKQSTTKPDYDGRFTFTNLSPGEWEIQLTPEKMEGQPTNPLFMVMIAQQTKQKVAVRDAASTEVVLKLPPPQSK